MFGNKFNVTW